MGVKMTKAMTKLWEMYSEYYDLKCSYCGDRTDWFDVEKKLGELHKKLLSTKIGYRTKTSNFEWFILQQLRSDVYAEYNRVEQICFRLRG